MQTSETLARVGQATPEQIAEWDKKYTGKYYEIECDNHVAYFRNPDRNVMNYAMSRVSQEAPLDYFENIMKETKIGGSDEIINDYDLFQAATVAMKEIIEGKKATLVKH